MNLLYANDRRGQHAPSWYAATAVPAPEHPPLRGQVRADVAIIGAGYTGMSAALHLAQAGLSVVVLEAHRIGWGASGRNGGQVGSGQRRDQAYLTARLGRENARRLWDLAEDAKTLVHDLIQRHRMPGVDWRPGIVHAARHPAEVDAAHAEAATLARNCGYDRIEPLDRAQITAILGTDAYAGGTLDHGAAHLHPLNFALGLARAAAAAGARIHELTEVQAIRHGRPAALDCATGAVIADHVIVAANGYLGRLLPEVAARVMPINNFIIATEPLGARAPMTRPVAAADSRFVVNYWRQTPDGRLLFGGGESYGWCFPDIARTVRRAMRPVYPDLADVRIDHAWGGTLAITVSRNPYFHRIAPNILTATGYSGHGVALATLAGQILAAAIVGQTGQFDLLSRLPVQHFPGGALLRHPALALAMTWYSLRDRLG